MRILIAEDERVTRMTLARHLQSWGHEVISTEDGQQAWERYEATPEIDIVITDWEMPRVSGVELVRRVRQSKRAGYAYLILLTGRSEKCDIVNGIEAGADDFVSKPFDRDELRVRLLAGERIVRLERTLSQQNTDLREANERIRTALTAAARVQQSMLPRQDMSTPQLRVAWKYVPTDELAGDAIGLHMIEERYLVAYVLDVSGHGVPAALLSVSAMQSLEPDPAETSLLRDFANGTPSLGTVRRPARIASELNRRFCAGDRDGRYLTMVLCVLDTFDGLLHLTHAGHPTLMLLRDGQPQLVPDSGGCPIAMFADADYDDARIQLQPGDRLCLYSDGVNEQPGAGGSAAIQFGKGRLLEGLSSRAHMQADQLVNELVGDLTAWAGSPSFQDDVSIVVLDWLGRDG